MNDPHFHLRVTIRDVISPKEYFGRKLKSRTIEAQIGNTVKVVTETNIKDVLDVENKSLKDLLILGKNESDAAARDSGWKFVDTGVSI